MKDRAIRRHQEFKVRKKLNKQYNSCIESLPSDARQGIEGSPEKLKRVCASPYDMDHDRALGKKNVQERKADISMREQLQ